MTQEERQYVAAVYRHNDFEDLQMTFERLAKENRELADSLPAGKDKKAAAAAANKYSASAMNYIYLVKGKKKEIAELTLKIGTIAAERLSGQLSKTGE